MQMYTLFCDRSEAVALFPELMGVTTCTFCTAKWQWDAQQRCVTAKCDAV